MFVVALKANEIIVVNFMGEDLVFNFKDSG